MSKLCLVVCCFVFLLNGFLINNFTELIYILCVCETILYLIINYRLTNFAKHCVHFAHIFFKHFLFILWTFKQQCVYMCMWVSVYLCLMWNRWRAKHDVRLSKDKKNSNQLGKLCKKWINVMFHWFTLLCSRLD